ncbi:hypothetical protein SESBI_17618 [Sesbania bispinosa]|nr:hypothetical protein SESBI_17618 [Sesbania bispinosa]
MRPEWTKERRTSGGQQRRATAGSMAAVKAWVGETRAASDGGASGRERCATMGRRPRRCYKVDARAAADGREAATDSSG